MATIFDWIYNAVTGDLTPLQRAEVTQESLSSFAPQISEDPTVIKNAWGTVNKVADYNDQNVSAWGLFTRNVFGVGDGTSFDWKTAAIVGILAIVILVLIVKVVESL